MKKILLILALSTLFYPLYADGDLVWTGSRLADWKPHRGTLTSKMSGGNLHLSLHKNDPQLICNVSFDPTQYDKFSFTYRATGPEFARGQLYYAHVHTPNNINDRARWLLPAIKNDGKWHTMTVNSSAIINSNNYFSCGMIAKLRFDITDSGAGNIEISEIRLINSKSGKQTVRWNSKNKFAGWELPTRLNWNLKGDVLELTNLKQDSSIGNSQVNFDPRKYTVFVYTYRARGTSPKNGQLFFGVDGKRTNADQMWRLPALIADNKWHTVKVYLQNQVDPVRWLKAGKITYLRFDPSDGPGGEIEIKDIHFESEPIVASNRAPNMEWKLDAPKWPDVKAHYELLIPPRAPGAYFEGNVIRAAADKGGDDKGSSSFFLRKSFDLKRLPIRAMLQFGGNTLTSASINGKNSGRNAYWRHPNIDEVSDLLKLGSNTLDFTYVSSQEPGGVLADLTLVYADGEVERIVTDDKFSWTSVVNGKPDLKKMQPVRCFPLPPDKPWVGAVEYLDFSRAQMLIRKTLTPQAVTAGDQVNLRMEFTGIMPDLPFSANITIHAGEREIWEESITIQKHHVKKISSQRWVLDLPYKVPLYLSSNQTRLRLTSNHIFLKNADFPSFPLQITQIASAPGFEQPVTSSMHKLPGYGAQMRVNGKPFFPAWGGMQRSKRVDQLPDHSRAKLNMITIYAPSISWFPGVGQFDPTIFDKTAEIFRRYNPNAYFVWDITMRMPRDFALKHPGEMCLDNEMQITTDGGPRQSNFSFSSDVAYGYFREAMLKAIDYLEKSPYANRIVGYRICGGHTIEWLGWDPEPGRITDFSPVVKPAFERFARENYPELQDFSIPTLAERKTLDNNEILWDQKKHLKSAAYQDFYSNEVADMLIDLCSEAKKFLNDRKIIVTYFGYTMTLGAGGSAQMRAHYAMKKFLDSNVADIILSPQPYRLRNIGDVYGDMKPFSSIANHGIMSVIEDDTRTSIGPPGLGYFQTPNLETTTKVLQRNMAFTLCRNQGGYYYALSAGTEFNYPGFALDFNAFRSTGEFLLEKKAPRKAEVAVVVSEKSITSMPMFSISLPSGELFQSYAKDGKTVVSKRYGNAVTTATLETNFNKIACAGAPVDYLLAEDLKDNPGSYKMYIFANVYKYDDDFLAAVKKLRSRKCTMLWLYAPGYSHNTATGVKSMEKLTGMKFSKYPSPTIPAVKLKNGQWIGSVFARIQPMFAVIDPAAEALGRYEDGGVGFAALKTGQAENIFMGAFQLTADFIRDLYRRAGVHIYSSEGDPMEANSHLVTIHSRSPGIKTIKLPVKTNVIDVFNAQLIARNVDKFSYKSDLHDSRLFYYGDDATQLLAKIKRERK